MSIRKSFSLGDKAEAECWDWLESLGFEVEKVPQEIRYDYDLKATKNKLSVTFEVKNDIKSAVTGNIAIEYFNSKKKEPSGISSTKADYWVHRFENKLWVIKTETLKNFIKKQTPKRIIIGGGDDNADLMLYDKLIFKEICIPVSLIDTDKKLFNIYEISNKD